MNGGRKYTKKQPNILFIMSDDHAANAISCYGSMLSEIFQTPNLDRIGNEGARLERFFATNAICTPARASIMTGQYGHISGVKTLADCWQPESTPNLAKLLKDNGYETRLFGKWHLGCEPIGFDDYKYLSKGVVGDKSGEQGVYFNPTFKEKGIEGAVQHEGYVTDIITDMTVEALDTRDKDKPFFIMCHHKAPHDFWEYNEKYKHIFDGVEIPVVESLFEDKQHRSIATRSFGSSVTPRSEVRSLYKDFSDPNYVVEPLVGTENMSFEEKGLVAYEKYIKDYLRVVASIDESVGTLMDKLEEQGILDDTIVIYTSDQGMFLGEHDYQDKRWSYEESLKAPFLIRAPWLIKQPQVNFNLMANIDIAPTLLRLAGVKVPYEMQGIDCTSIFEGDKPRDSVYYRYWMHLAHNHDNPAHYGIRTDHYKITYYYGMPLDAKGAQDKTTPKGWELYDLRRDPNELHNVYEDPCYSDIRKDMKEKLFKVKNYYSDTDELYNIEVLE